MIVQKLLFITIISIASIEFSSSTQSDSGTRISSGTPGSTPETEDIKGSPKTPNGICCSPGGLAQNFLYTISREYADRELKRINLNSDKSYSSALNFLSSRLLL